MTTRPGPTTDDLTSAGAAALADTLARVQTVHRSAPPAVRAIALAVAAVWADWNLTSDDAPRGVTVVEVATLLGHTVEYARRIAFEAADLALLRRADVDRWDPDRERSVPVVAFAPHTTGRPYR